MTRGEDRTSTFLLTALSTGFLTEALTRFISLMRVTHSVVICGIIGLVSLIFLFMHFGLGDD